MIKDPTCFKNPLNPSSIDLMLTNRPGRFQDNLKIEKGIYDHHKMSVLNLRLFFQKQFPTIIKYRDYNNFNTDNFRNQLLDNLIDIGEDITFEII